MRASEPPQTTPVGILGTLGAWHRWAPNYDLDNLAALVRGFAPELLCTDIDRADWEAGRLAALPVEYRECLVPVCRELSAVMVPVGAPWRVLASPLRVVLGVCAGPRWTKSLGSDRCHRIWARLWPGSRRSNRQLVANILQAVRRDPGRRVLVTVRIERRYAVVQGLCQAEDMGLVPV